jgi:choline dehydrogenase-like flavoprotein
MEIAAGFISLIPTTIVLNGTVRLASTDPLANPVIDYKLDNRHEDAIFAGANSVLFPVVNALRAANLIGAGFTALQPGASEATIRNFIRSDSPGSLRTNFHPAGSARVGAASDPSAVVDSHFRVHGIPNLRVVDASVHRILPTGNINSPTLLLGYFASDLIRSDRGLSC